MIYYLSILKFGHNSSGTRKSGARQRGGAGRERTAQNSDRIFEELEVEIEMNVEAPPMEGDR